MPFRREGSENVIQFYRVLYNTFCSRLSTLRLTYEEIATRLDHKTQTVKRHLATKSMVKTKQQGEHLMIWLSYPGQAELIAGQTGKKRPRLLARARLKVDSLCLASRTVDGLKGWES